MLSPFLMRVPGIGLRSSDTVTGAFLAEPSCLPGHPVFLFTDVINSEHLSLPVPL